MQRVAIIGAGELGGATAHALARSNLVRSITLIDETRRVAAGKALDRRGQPMTMKMRGVVNPFLQDAAADPAD